MKALMMNAFSFLDQTKADKLGTQLKLAANVPGVVRRMFHLGPIGTLPFQFCYPEYRI